MNKLRIVEKEQILKSQNHIEDGGLINRVTKDLGLCG